MRGFHRFKCGFFATKPSEAKFPPLICPVRRKILAVCRAFCYNKRNAGKKTKPRAKPRTNPMLSQSKPASSPASQALPPGTPAPLRGRAIAAGAVAAALTAVLVTQAEIVLSTVKIGYLQFPPAALAMLLLAVLVNRGLKKISARFGFSGADLLVIYCMALVAAMVSSHGVVQKLVPLLVIPKHYADAANNWHQLYDLHVPRWMVPYDPSDPHKQAVAEDYYSKLPLGHGVPWGAWITPLLAWGVLIVLVLFSFLCLTAILRRQWVDNERLAFPLAQLPLEVAGDADGSKFFRSGPLWAGVAVPVIVFGLKAIHLVQPTVPDVTLQWNLHDYVSAPPWNVAADGITFILSFAAIGFFFLLPTDILFSIWFFFLLSRLEVAIGTSFNMDLPGMPQFPPPLLTGYQAMGAYLVLALSLAWSARTHLKTVWRSAIGRESADDSGELLPYRVAFWGLLGSLGGAVLWLWWAGMSPWLAVMELVIGLFMIGVVMARSTAEAGMLMTETTFRPVNFYQLFAPMHTLGPTNLTLLVFFDSLFLRDQRGLLLCGFLDSARIADGARLRRRSFVGALAVGVFVALIVATFLNVTLPYQMGAVKMDQWMEQGNSRWTFNDTSAFALNPPLVAGASWQMPTFFGVGVLMTVFLTVMRTFFFWWPLHPLGYALAGSWSTMQFWFPCFVAWALKSLCLRYGGMGLFTRARPLFLGLVIGEFGMAALSVILNLLFRIPAPAFPWN